ncbi:MAG: hypothetical protein AB8H79_11915 [Myxococcota bacterium]
MRSSGVIAGSLALTLVGGGLAAIFVVGAALLWWGAPTSDNAALRHALVDHQEDLAYCAAGTPGGELTLTLVVHRGIATHVGATKATVDTSVASCVAESMASRSWPPISGAVTLPIRLQP